MIHELNTYQDDEGRIVVKHTCISDSSMLFTGKQRVKTADMKEWDWEFAFPTDVQTLESAFERFDEVCKRRLDEHNEKFKK